MHNICMLICEFAVFVCMNVCAVCVCVCFQDKVCFPNACGWSWLLLALINVDGVSVKVFPKQQEQSKHLFKLVKK